MRDGCRQKQTNQISCYLRLHIQRTRRLERGSRHGSRSLIIFFPFTGRGGGAAMQAREITLFVLIHSYYASSLATVPEPRQPWPDNV